MFGSTVMTCFCFQIQVKHMQEVDQKHLADS